MAIAKDGKACGVCAKSFAALYNLDMAESLRSLEELVDEDTQSLACRGDQVCAGFVTLSLC